MRRRLRLALVLTPLPALLAHSAFAQDAVQMPLFGGALLFRGDVGVTRDERSAERVNMEFWRPLTFGPADRPIGGRMDCQLAGVEQPFTADSFDLKSRYEASIPQRKRAGLKDDAVISDGAAEINHLQVSGAANNPHRHYVLTYLALRRADRLYDLRMNCEFRHLQDPGDTDYAAIMHDHLDIAVPGLGAPNTQTSDG